MLHILFVPGTFGSTIQYILRAFSTTYSADRLPNITYADMITPDGSMHSYYKTGHYVWKYELDDLVGGLIDKPLITSPIYPMPDFHADELINFFKINFPDDKYVFVYVDSLEYAEINMLAQYYKIAKGVSNKTLEIFCGKNEHNIINWNINYKHWSEMQLWELREWLSTFYPTWVQGWIDSYNYADQNWLSVSSKEILDNPHDTFLKVLNYSGEIDSNLISTFSDFTTHWRSQQQYLLDEYNLIKKIVQTSIANEPYEWSELNIISEAIIQQHLRSNGYEIACYELNKFPTSSTVLHSLLEKS